MTSPVNTSYLKAHTKNIEAPSGQTYAYRELGPRSSASSTEDGNDIPIIMFVHLAANLDNWDPLLVDELAQKRHVIAFDQAGVGLSSGKVPDTVEEMANHAFEFIATLGYTQVDMFGFSLGGFVVQDLVLKHPTLARKIILTGTGPRGGAGIDGIIWVFYRDVFRSVIGRCDPKEILFFHRNTVGIQAGKEFIARLEQRKKDRDREVPISIMRKQLAAIQRFAKSTPSDLSKITHPTLIANGDDDGMLPSSLSQDLHKRIKGSELILYPDSGHGGIFQYVKEFAPKAAAFLNAPIKA